MKGIAYYNGKIGRIDEVQAPITDRGFYFGDGVLRCGDGQQQENLRA